MVDLRELPIAQWLFRGWQRIARIELDGNVEGFGDVGFRGAERCNHQ